jgi:hypothetical protein
MLAPKVWCGGILESGRLFCIGVFGRNLACYREDFSHLIHFIKKLDKFCFFSAIWKKNNAAINYISVQNKKVLFPST